MSALRQAALLSGIFMLVVLLASLLLVVTFRARLETEISIDLASHFAFVQGRVERLGPETALAGLLEPARATGLLIAFMFEDRRILGDIGPRAFAATGQRIVDEATLLSRGGPGSWHPGSWQTTDWFGPDWFEPDWFESDSQVGPAWGEIFPEDESPFDPGDFQWITLVGAVAGGQLAVAVPLDGLDLTGNALLFALVSCGLLLVAMTLVGGLLFGLRAQRRITHIGQRLEAIAAGDLSVRIAPARPVDDLDVVAAQIDGTTARLEILMDQVRHLSVNLAHDLRTPLARLRSHLETGAQGRAGAAIVAAMAETDRVIAVFEAVLRIARLDAGEGRNRFIRIDPGKLAGEVAETFGPVVEESGRTFKFSPETTATICGDRQILIQALANLLQNAMAHTPAGSTVTLFARGCNLGVADNGPGIPAGERERVLQPMYRLDASRGTPGAGLGLAMVRAGAALHGATLHLTATRPTAPFGLTVTLSFPLARF